jgi:hypothetical protein
MTWFYFVMEERKKMSETEILREYMGKCWHSQKTSFCDSCYPPRDFMTWEGFGKLWNWTTKQKWWHDFKNDFMQKDIVDGAVWCPSTLEVHSELIDPIIFAKAVADFLQKKYNDQLARRWTR